MSLDWQIDPKTLLFITDSKGFSRGGLNLTANLPPGPGRFFAPESLNNVEAGIKADWDLPLDMKARTNVSYFYGFYDNIQVSAATPIVDALGNVTTTVLTQNAATAHLDGIDFDLTLLPTDSLAISGGGVWTHATYDQYNYCAKFVGNPPVCAAGQLYDISGSQVIWDPKWTWRVRVAYILPVDESLGKVTVAAVMNHVGGSYSSTGINPPAAGWPSIPPQDFYPATTNVDMSLVWTNFLGRSGLDATATVENLFNTPRDFSQFASHWLSGGGSQVTGAPPRMWTVAVKYAFGP
jgi:iron complex outermembrane receptor protein